jgi:hypothetical protein
VARGLRFLCSLQGADRSAELNAAGHERIDSRKRKREKTVEYILLTTMFLFICFCTFILGLAISQTFGKGKNK